MQLNKNGVGAAGSLYERRYHADATALQGVGINAVSAVMAVVAGDYIEVEMYNGGSSSFNVLGSTHCSMEIIE